MIKVIFILPKKLCSVLNLNDFTPATNWNCYLVFPQVTLSNRNGPTEIDVKQMNLLYKCSGGGGGGDGGGGGGGDGDGGGGGGGVGTLCTASLEILSYS